MPRQSADAGVNGRSTSVRPSDRFLAELHDASLVTFVSHVNPDPDSLGSMLGLAHHLGGRYEAINTALDGSSLTVVTGAEGVPGLREKLPAPRKE